MKFIIDTEKIDASGVSADVLMYLMALYLRSPITFETFNKLSMTNYIYYDDVKGGLPSGVKLLEEGAEIIEEVFLSSELEKTESDKDRYTRLAETLIEMFPEGRKAGTTHYWRGNVKDISRRLKKFFKIYGDRTDDEIIKATKRYVESFNGNYQYMRVLKYFIWKDQKKMNDEGEIYVDPTSELANILENKEVTYNDDWASVLR